MFPSQLFWPSKLWENSPKSNSQAIHHLSVFLLSSVSPPPLQLCRLTVYLCAHALMPIFFWEGQNHALFPSEVLMRFHMQISHASLSPEAFTWTSYSFQLPNKTHLSRIVVPPATGLLSVNAAPLWLLWLLTRLTVWEMLFTLVEWNVQQNRQICSQNRFLGANLRSYSNRKRVQ